MRYFFMTSAAVAALFATNFAAQALPLAPLRGANVPLQNVSICFYIDGWNGPGLYECGYRHRRGAGWVGRREEGRRDRGGDRREDRHEHREDRRGDRDDRR